MKKRVSELIDTELNYCVAIAAGHEAEIVGDRGDPEDHFCTVWRFSGMAKSPNGCAFFPSTDWKQGGPIMQTDLISVIYHPVDDIGQPGIWRAHRCAVNGPECEGPTPLIAAMRVYVMHRLGDEIEVPDA